MRIYTGRLSVINRIGEMICQLVLADGNWDPVGSRPARHFLGDSALVIGLVVEAQRECADWVRSVLRCKAEYGTGIQAAAQITADWHISAEADPDRIVENAAEAINKIGIGWYRFPVTEHWVIHVPVLCESDTIRVCRQVVSRGHSENVLKKRTSRGNEAGGKVNRLGIPARWNAGREERLHLGRDIERALMG